MERLILNDRVESKVTKPTSLPGMPLKEKLVRSSLALALFLSTSCGQLPSKPKSPLEKTSQDTTCAIVQPGEGIYQALNRQAGGEVPVRKGKERLYNFEILRSGSQEVEVYSFEEVNGPKTPTVFAKDNVCETLTPTLSKVNNLKPGQLARAHPFLSIVHDQNDLFDNIAGLTFDQCWKRQAECGPTAFSMFMEGYGFSFSPRDMNRLFAQRGYKECGDNFSLVQGPNGAINYLIEQGFEVVRIDASGQDVDWQKAKELKEQGFRGIYGGIFYHIPEIPKGANHILLVNDVDPEKKKLQVSDPWGGEEKVIDIAQTDLLYAFYARPRLNSPEFGKNKDR